jgi:choice-of-anchor A domain-containing protein
VKLANTTAASLTPDETFASLGGSPFTITPIGAANGSGGHNTVVDVTGSITITNPSKDLTISGGANDFYIVNVGGDVTVSNGQILLSGGITPSNVLFNFTGAGGAVNLTNASSTLNGIFLAPLSGQSINLTPGTVNGVIISDMIHTSSGPDINGGGTGTGSGSPEPASLGVLALGALGLVVRRRRA